MRVLAVIFALTICTPAMSASLASQIAEHDAAKCPKTASHLATDGSRYSGKKLMPQRLGELPPGTPYMAVYRRIGGCESPLTMVEYRNPRRR